MNDANCPTCLALQAEVARLTQEQERLQPYLRHKPECACLSHRRSDDGGWTYAFPAKDCTCGLRPAALASLPQEGTK
jgi:hypothetical protein